jgi:alkylation response protein AidB-like acyl-CoA dehydrogenase
MDRQAHPDPIEAARNVKAAIIAASDEIERTRRVPEPLMAELIRSRLLRMLLPRSADGDEVHPAAYLTAIEEVARHDASIGWNVFVANSSALIAAFLDLAVAREIFADPASIVAWGPPNANRATAVADGYRVSGTWDFASGCRQASWMGAHCHVLEPDCTLRRNRLGRPVIRSLLFPVGHATLIDNWNPIGLRGTGSDGYSVTDLFVPEAYSTTREEPEQRRERGPLYAFTMQGLYAVGVAGVALGVARAMLQSFIELACRKTPRAMGRLADSAVVQGDVARAEARLGAAHAYLVETLSSVYGQAEDVPAIGIADRARVRLACTNAIHGAIEVANLAYKGAGVDAIFPGTPFERRFRDIHTLSQQIQSRSAHFEVVGQVLLGMPPEPFF